MTADLSMDVGACLETIASAGAALSDAGRVKPDATVPWCPGWTVSSVLRHAGGVHEWVAAMVRTAASKPLPSPAEPGLTGDALADWADERRHWLLAALADADAEWPMWVFGSQLPTRFWARRQAHETAVHAVDATAAAGEPWRIPGQVADDGLSEFLAVFLPVQWQRRPDLGRRAHRALSPYRRRR